MTLLAVLLTLAPTPLPAAPPAQPTAEVAALTAEADAVIRAASAQGRFTNDTRWDFPAVRHTASGMRCLFQPGRGDNAIVWVGSEGGASCSSRPAEFSQTLTAERLAPGETLDAVFARSAREAAGPDARPYAGAPLTVRVEPAAGVATPEQKNGGWFVRRGEEEVFSRVAVAVVDGWVVRQRFEAPAARADDAELLAGVVMATTLIDMAGRSAG